MSGRWGEVWASAQTEPDPSMAAARATKSRRLIRAPTLGPMRFCSGPAIALPSYGTLHPGTASGVIGITDEHPGESIFHPRSPDAAAKAAACVSDEDVSRDGDLDRGDGRVGRTSRQAARLLGQCGLTCARGTGQGLLRNSRIHQQAEPLRVWKGFTQKHLILRTKPKRRMLEASPL